MDKNQFSMFKAIPIILIVMMSMTAGIWADVYIKQEVKTEDVYHHGNVEPGGTVPIEYWIGEGKLAYREGNTGLLLDQSEGKAFFLSHGMKVYAEITLPVNLDKVADETFAPRLQMFRTQGEIKPLDKEKKIAERNCQMTEITTWISFENVRYNETVSEVCLTTDLPFDLKAAAVLLKELQGLNNFDEGIYKEMIALEGFPIESDSTRYMEGIHIPSKLRTLEIVSKEAPPEIYSIPDDYTKKEKLNREEILNR